MGIEMPNQEPNYVDVDKYRLDEEWEQQPRAYRQEAEKAAELRLDLNEAEANLKLVGAQLLLSISQDPSAYDLPKGTADLLKAAVLVQPGYMAATKKVNLAQYALDVQMAVVRALEHKKTALDNLTGLDERAYFAGTASAKVDAKRREQRDKRTDSRIAKRLNNRGTD